MDKILLILAAQEKPTPVSEIKKIADSIGIRGAKKWNISQILGTSKGKAIKVRGCDAGGWELTEHGKQYLSGLGVYGSGLTSIKVVAELRKYLENIKDVETRSFVEEAIKCHEMDCYRSAIVMSWLGAMDVLRKHIYAHYLNEFNAEAKKFLGNRWRNAISSDDFGKMKESDFLDLVERIGVIGKNVKNQLKKALDLRNGCGHPNSLRVGECQSAAHIELLLKNVFSRFCI